MRRVALVGLCLLLASSAQATSVRYDIDETENDVHLVGNYTKDDDRVVNCALLVEWGTRSELPGVVFQDSVAPYPGASDWQLFSFLVMHCDDCAGVWFRRASEIWVFTDGIATVFVQPIPEPGSLVLLFLGLLVVQRARRAS